MVTRDKYCFFLKMDRNLGERFKKLCEQRHYNKTRIIVSLIKAWVETEEELPSNFEVIRNLIKKSRFWIKSLLIM